MHKPLLQHMPKIEHPVLIAFQGEGFRERLQKMVQQTQEYGGVLPRTWEKVETGMQCGSVPQRVQSLTNEHARHIRNLVQRIRNANVDSITIEASHAYLYDSMSDQDFVRSMETQYKHANALAQSLEANRVQVQRVLFVDNYNPPPGSDTLVHNLDLEAYLECARDNGYQPDYLIMEADMDELARTLVEYMHNVQGLVLHDTNGSGPDDSTEEDRKLLKHRSVELVKDSGSMSCASLDAALSLVKYQYLASGIVNVLPKHQGAEGFSFKGQQRKVRQILGEHLNMRVLPFFNIFTSDTPEKEHSSGAHVQFRKPVN